MRFNLLVVGMVVLGLTGAGRVGEARGPAAAKPAAAKPAAVQPARAAVSAVGLGNFEIQMERAEVAKDASHHRVTIQGKTYFVPANLMLKPAFIGQDSSGQVIILTAGGIQGVPESVVNQPPPTNTPIDQPPPTNMPGE